MQSVPTVTAWLDRQKPPKPQVYAVTVPKGQNTITVTIGAGGGGGWPSEGEPAQGQVVIRYKE